MLVELIKAVKVCAPLGAVRFLYSIAHPATCPLAAKGNPFKDNSPAAVGTVAPVLPLNIIEFPIFTYLKSVLAGPFVPAVPVQVNVKVPSS